MPALCPGSFIYGCNCSGWRCGIGAGWGSRRLTVRSNGRQQKKHRDKNCVDCRKPHFDLRRRWNCFLSSQQIGGAISDLSSLDARLQSTDAQRYGQLTQRIVTSVTWSRSQSRYFKVPQTSPPARDRKTIRARYFLPSKGVTKVAEIGFHLTYSQMQGEHDDDTEPDCA